MAEQKQRPVGLIMATVFAVGIIVGMLMNIEEELERIRVAVELIATMQDSSR